MRHFTFLRSIREIIFLSIALVFSACDELQPDPPAAVILQQPQIIQDTLVAVTWTQSGSVEFLNYLLVWDTLEAMLTGARDSNVIAEREKLSDTLFNLKLGKTHYLKLFVQESDGDSAGSNMVSIFLNEPVIPHTLEPVQVTAPEEIGYTFASFSWSQSSEPGFAYYETWLDTSPDFQSAFRRSDVIALPEDSIITYHDLNPASRYFFQIWLHLVDGDSVASTPIEFSTLSNLINSPIVITGVEQAGVDAAVATWSSCRTGNFVAYELFLAEDDSLDQDFFRVVSHDYAADTSYSFQDLQIDRQYYTRVALHLEKGDHIISAAYPFRLENRFANRRLVTNASGFTETDLAGYYLRVQTTDADGDPLPGVSINMTRSDDHLIIVGSSGNTQPRYRALILSELDFENVSGSGSSSDPLVVTLALDPITLGYQTYLSDSHNTLGSFLFSSTVVVYQATGSIFDIQSLLVEHLDEIGAIIQLSNETAEELSTDPLYLSLSADIFLQGGNWYEVVIGDALGLYADDEILYGWGETAEGVVITPVYLGEVAISHNFMYKFTLTWGRHPRDLDSYLWTPEISGQRQVVYYGNRGSEVAPPYAELDLDDVDSWGPESITITQLFPGTYRYSVHHYAGWENDSLDIANSQAEVRLADPNGVVQVFNVPEMPCEDWWFWHILEIDGATGNITILNELSPVGPDYFPQREQVLKN